MRAARFVVTIFETHRKAWVANYLSSQRPPRTLLLSFGKEELETIGRMAADVSLLNALADALPKGLELRVYHISTRPTPVPALYSAAPDQSEQKTFCESHLLSIAFTQADTPHELLIFAIEVLVFTTLSLTTIFVSKADSTGFRDILKLDNISGSVIKGITATFLRFLVHVRNAAPRVVLSLFARSQNQYLFPGSVEYAGKHVLDDRQLIRWWCTTVDPVIRSPVLGANADTAAYVLVPGCDKSVTKAFFPASARQDPPLGSRWVASYPMELLVPDTSAPLRCLIPRLPDDPKSRFLIDLDDSKDEKGRWRSIKTMEQFWEMMSYRQECSAGRLVGFIWVVFNKRKEISKESNTNGKGEEGHEQQTDDKVGMLPTPSQSQVAGNNVDPTHEVTTSDLQEITLPGSPPPSSRVPPMHESSTLEAGDPDTEAAQQYYDENRNIQIEWPKVSRGELIVSSEQYDTLLDHLLQLDFSTRADGEKGTSSFIAKASELAGTVWGKSITGRGTSLEHTGTPSIPQENGVNILTGVRKKRKVESVEEMSAPPQPTVNTLSAGLVRKKAKT